MTTNFFSQVLPLMEAGKLNMTIAKINEKVSVMIVLESKEKAFEPIVISGTIDELDSEFFSVLNKDKINEVKGIVSNIEENIKILRQIDQAEKDKLQKKRNPKQPSKPATANASLQKIEDEEEEEEEDNAEETDSSAEIAKPKAVETPTLF
jgi:PRTRC genetic system protein E